VAPKLLKMVKIRVTKNLAGVRPGRSTCRARRALRCPQSCPRQSQTNNPKQLPHGVTAPRGATKSQGELRSRRISSQIRFDATLPCQERQACTLSHSKKLRNNQSAVALFIAHLNFCRLHSAHGATPAMVCGLTNHFCTAQELVEQQSKHP